MRLYAEYLLPRLTHLAMRNKAAAAERGKLVPAASGTVLEIGIGSGLNVPYYGPAVEALYGVDPSRELWRLGRARAEKAPFPIHFLPVSAERIPLEDASIDTAVSTWVLCTIPDLRQALGEIRRVLKPGGRFIFIEHGAAPQAGVRVWQDRLTPIWRRIAGNCHMNRAIDLLVTEAGFDLERLDASYARGPRLLAYLFRGIAHRACGRPTGTRRSGRS
jgi:ubiquinone/menaquinone biosynthesis C-methylase UbiE